MSPAATRTARFIGLLAFGWTWLAYRDLRWLLHVHAVHVRILHDPFNFNYNAFFAITLVNVAASIVFPLLLLLFPALLLRALASRVPRPPSSPAILATAVALGLALLLLGLYTIISTLLWTVFSSGNNSGWQLDLAISFLVAAVGFILCRRVLTPPAALP